MGFFDAMECIEVQTNGDSDSNSDSDNKDDSSFASDDFERRASQA